MRTLSISNALLASVAVVFGGLALCGGGNQQSPPPPLPDFSISVSPSSASGTIGNMRSTLTVSVTPQNGFNDPVTVTLLGLPSGVSANPDSSFAVQSGANQAVVLFISGSSMLGMFQLTITGTSGEKSHNAQLILTTEPVVQVNAYQNGSVLYLEADSGTDRSRTVCLSACFIGKNHASRPLWLSRG